MPYRRESDRVFLNVPFDREYEPLFLGLIAALVHLGKRPTTVLDVAGVGSPRLDLLVGRIRSCAFSVHDLSRVACSGRGKSAVPRFNMPFELGLAVAIAREPKGPEHGFVILEAKRFRLQRSLSDMNGYDPCLHGGTQSGAVRCMFEVFADAGTGDAGAARRIARDLGKFAVALKREHKVKDLFSRVVVNDLVQAATELVA